MSSVYPGRNGSSSFSHNTSRFNLEANEVNGDDTDTDIESERDWHDEPEVASAQRAPSKMSEAVAIEVSVQLAISETL